MWGVTRITRADQLLGEIDAEERHARIPRHHVIKGLHFARLADALGDEWSRLLHDLADPPPHGRHVAFRDYPQADYSRALCAVAHHVYGRLPRPEAIRRIARGEFRAFAESQLGAVMMTMITDVTTAFQKLPDVHRIGARGGDIETRALDGGFELEFREWYGWADCQPLGIVEGVLDYFDENAAVALTFRSDSQTRIEVRFPQSSGA